MLEAGPQGAQGSRQSATSDSGKHMAVLALAYGISCYEGSQLRESWGLLGLVQLVVARSILARHWIHVSVLGPGSKQRNLA